jgi:hypothetical protein
MPGIYPMYHSLAEKMAAKVITRVVSDGVALSDAIKEAVKYADLTRQQTIHMCAVLQDYGMVYNGDAKNYFHITEDMGKAFPNAVDGYNVYAHSNGKLKTGTLNKIFATIDELRKRGFKDDEIVAFNPDLESILAAINDADAKLHRISSELNTRIQESNTSVSAPAPAVSTPAANEVDEEEALELAAMFSKDRIVSAQVQDVEVEAPTDENVANTLQEATSGADEQTDDAISFREDATDAADDDLGNVDVEEEFSEGENLGGSVNAKVRPTPEEIESRLADAPKWEVRNILSIQSAEKFYDNLRKELEAVVFNENIVLDEDALTKYDQIRAKIDGEVDKISSAQKETKKLEEKETDLEEQFEEQPTEDLAAGELPTEEIIEEEVPTAAPAPETI